MIRLNKFLAEAGVCSRRQADLLIAAGRVSVNDLVFSELGIQIDPSRDQVRVDGQLVAAQGLPEFQYLILNKPPGYLSTVKDARGRPTVMDLLPPISTRIYPVGRLDLDTSGLLLFTNDGAMALALTHPRHIVEKVYLAEVRGVPGVEKLTRLAAGILLEDGPTAPANVELERAQKGNAIIRLTIREGRKRQVKRMMSAIGHPVLSLERIAFGPIALGDLKLGGYRRPNQAELQALLEIKRRVDS